MKKDRSHDYRRIALACQGGGSLGAYHIGVYQAMHENGFLPDMVSGISIGAFTAAIIAGNDPDKRTDKLNEFWETISWPDFQCVDGSDDDIKASVLHNKISSMQGFILGQPNFFTPRFPAPQFYPDGTIEATSYYDTTPILENLPDFVDFKRINSGKTRLILGATRVKDGELVFFDSDKIKIGPEHVVASGSMPPGFPGTRIDGDLYWDGGCVSNTPVDGIFNAKPSLDTLVFMIDLFNPVGKEPANLDDVSTRSKDILYTSRTSHNLEHISKRHNLARALGHIYELLPQDAKNDPVVKELKEYTADTRFDVVHVIYDPPEYEISTKDCEFSRSSIKKRAEHGYDDIKKIIAQTPWLKSVPAHKASSVHKFMGSKHSGTL
jgi:NTE family protein